MASAAARQRPQPTGPGDLSDMSAGHNGVKASGQPEAPRPSGLAAMATNECTAFIHLHRAEMGAMLAYMSRMDNATNWAVSMTGILMVFALNSALVPHYFFLIMLALNVFFLCIEARRWSLYSYSRARIIMMEHGFHGRVVMAGVDVEPSTLIEQEKWQHGLKALMLAPTQNVERITWAGVWARFTRHYAVFILAVYAGWCFKLFTTNTRWAWLWITVVGAVGLLATCVLYAHRPPPRDMFLPAFDQATA